MKKNIETIKQLDTLLSTVNLVGIDRLIIEDGKIRAADEKKTVAVVTTKNVPDLGDLSLGLNRLGTLNSRLNLVKANQNAEIEFLAFDGDEIKQINLSAGKTKVQYRCASPETIKGVPKNVNDAMIWGVSVDNTLVPTVNAAVSAMGAEHIVFTMRNGEVSVECMDVNNDVFTMTVSEKVDFIGDDAAPSNKVFCHYYPAKPLLALLKQQSKEFTLTIGEKGVLVIEVNGYDFYILPQQV